MAKEQAIHFLEKLKNNKELLKQFEGRENPKTPEEATQLYSEIASVNGETISAADFAEALKEMKSKVSQKTKKTAAKIEALSEAELGAVAGGKSKFYLDGELYEGCVGAHDGWCFKVEACDGSWNHYICDENYSDSDCIATSLCDSALFPVTKATRKKLSCPDGWTGY